MVITRLWIPSNYWDEYGGIPPPSDPPDQWIIDSLEALGAAIGVEVMNVSCCVVEVVKEYCDLFLCPCACRCKPWRPWTVAVAVKHEN
ncbi:hypothetical protein Sjap_010681 [Stephania japonica]|uniref:Uncharacterized protein n=1 Tax=Stephania japonica TaxID=461633 RepID=A0AAP0P4T3_9MAGN